MTSPGTDTLLERLHDFVAAESKRWCNYATGEITFIEVSLAGKLVQEALEALARPAQRPPFAWLIEREFGSVLHYYAPTEPGEWTRDHLKACRFARKQDAEAIQFRHVARGHLPEGGTRVCEHGWMDRVARELCAGDGEA